MRQSVSLVPAPVAASLVLALAGVTAAAVAAAPQPAEAGEVRGRLLLGERPAAGVSVSAVPYETPLEEARREARRQGAPKAFASVKSGADGIFLLTLPPEASGRSYRVRMEGSGVVPFMASGVYDSTESADLGDETLAAAGKLAGRVVDAKGQPLAGVEVTLRSRAGGPGPFAAQGDTASVPRLALTGADGSFRFEDARATGNQLTAEAKGFATAQLDNLAQGALARPFTLQPGLSISGVVLLASRKPAPGALVRFEGAAASRWVEASADGSFRLADLPPGSGTLVADGGELGLAELRGLQLPESAAQKVQVVLAPAAAIEGRAVDAKTGAAIPRVKVLARSGSRTTVGRAGADGRYRISGLLPQRYRVIADDPRYVPYERDRVVVLAGTSEKVDLPLVAAAGISGRVVDESGAPVAGASGRLAPAGESGFSAFVRQQRAGRDSSFRTAADGTFKAARLMPGDNQQLYVTHPEFEQRVVGGVSLPAGRTKTGVSVVLSRGLSLLGVVKDEEGKPVVGAEVLLNQAFGFRAGRGGAVAQMSFIGGPENRPRVTTGADGSFEFKGLRKGEYTLVARMAGLADAVLDPAKVAFGSEPVELVMGAGATVSGLVVDQAGQPAAGYFVQVRPRGGEFNPLRAGPGRNATGADGFYSVDGLRAGETYDLMVLGGEGPGPRREGVTAPAEGVDLVVSGSGRIAGRVMDAQSGQSVSDFEVSFNPDRSGRGGGIVVRMAGPGARRGAGQREQFHSDDGSFVLDEVPPGTWDVNVNAKGYQAGRVGGVVVEPGQARDGVVVKLSRGSAIRGRVLDAATGRGVPDARVTAETAGGQPRMMALDLLNGSGGIATDADGMFEIDGLSQGSYMVSAEHRDYSDASQLVDVKEGVATTELRLAGGAVLGGAVVSETRRPLAGAQVSLEAAGEGGFGGRRGPFGGGQGSVTDEQGRFRFDHLVAGRYRVVASLRERSSAPADVVLQASEAKEDVQLQLQAGATIRGVVTGLLASARGGVMVNAMGPDSYFATTRTGGDGSFDLDGVPAGTITLRAMAGDLIAGGQRSATATVKVPDGQPEVQAEIAFESGYTLTGTVTRGGQPVADAFVTASARGGSGMSASGRTDASGAYRLEGLQAEGTYVVGVFSSSGGSASQQVEVRGDMTLDIRIPVARLAGTVVEAGSRQPLAEALVQVDAADASSAGPRRMLAATTDSNGRFAIEDLEEAAYTLTARRAGFLFDKREVAAREQGSDEILIELQRGEGIGLQARDGIFGIPLRGLVARVADAAGTNVFLGSVPLDSEGRGEIPSIKPGQYSVTVDASGYAPLSFAASVPSQPVAVALTPGGTLEIHAGQATLGQGQASAQLLDDAGRPYVFSIFGPAGRVVINSPLRRLENVAPGRYTLELTGGKPQSLTVAEGQTTVVELP